ncbi:MAG: hypothetical protein V4717_14510 [Bacteroidota bacterium]
MKNANDQLAAFTGTTKWFKHPLFGKLYTEGVKHMAETFGAYWLIDVVFSHQLLSKVKNEAFQTWTLKRITGNSFIVVATDGNENIIASQQIPFSDFNADVLTLFYTDDVLMLPSEY